MAYVERREIRLPPNHWFPLEARDGQLFLTDQEGRQWRWAEINVTKYGLEPRGNRLQQERDRQLAVIKSQHPNSEIGTLSGIVTQIDTKVEFVDGAWVLPSTDTLPQKQWVVDRLFPGYSFFMSEFE